MRGPNKPGTSGNRFTDRRKEIYLAELRRTGRKGAARLAANISNPTLLRHRKKDLDFAEGEELALVAFKVSIEKEIKRRGMDGVLRPITVAGKKVTVRDYDSRLLIELARAHMDEYKPHVKIDQRTEHSGSLALEADLSKLDARGRELLRELLQCEIEEVDDDVPEEEAEVE